jgi:hypothetical protein
MFDPVTMLAALAPTAVRTADALIQRYIVPDTIKPATVEQAVALANVDVEKLRIVTQADAGGDTYKWVEAVRKLQRPVVVFATLAAFLYNPAEQAVAELFQVVMWYLFGERITPNWVGVKK